MRIPTKGGNIRLNPLERLNLIVESGISGRVFRLSVEKAEATQSVLNGHHNDVSHGGEVAAVVGDREDAARLEATLTKTPVNK